MSKVIMHRFKATIPVNTRNPWAESKRITLHSRLNRDNVAVHRFISMSSGVCSRAPPQRKSTPEVFIPGLERITYADRMHYVPGLAKPTFPQWRRDWHDPHHYSGPKYEEMPLHKETPCYIFNQRTNMLEENYPKYGLLLVCGHPAEQQITSCGTGVPRLGLGVPLGVKQALWLTKTKLIKGLPPHILSLAEDTTNQIENQDERVQNAIKHARFWDTTESRPGRERFCPKLLQNLLHLCRTEQVNHPALGKRILAENYSLAAFWERGEDLFQVRGKNGILLNSMSPLPAVAGKEEVASTVDHVLETFHPISPTIDLQVAHTYRTKSHTGFEDGYRYPHAHTLFVMETGVKPRLEAEQLRAKMIVFAFGNALARAQAFYGPQPQVLEQPVVVQGVATNGRTFQFAVFQLNTTELGPDTGVKNMVWLEEDQPLYDYAKVRPLIKKKVVQVPAGLAGYQPETFKKFLALYLHGAV